MIYKIENSKTVHLDTDGVGTFIPFDMGNMDCRKFVADWKGGLEVKDADDNVVPYSDAACEALGLDPTGIDPTPEEE